MGGTVESKEGRCEARQKQRSHDCGDSRSRQARAAAARHRRGAVGPRSLHAPTPKSSRSSSCACARRTSSALLIASSLNPFTIFRFGVFLSTPLRCPTPCSRKGSSRRSAAALYLAELADNTFALTNWQRHAEIVKRTAILRASSSTLPPISTPLAYDAPDDLNQVVEEAEKMLFNVTEKRVSSTFTKMDVLLTEAFRGYHQAFRAAKPYGGRADPASRTPTTCFTAFAVATWSSSRRVPVSERRRSPSISPSTRRSPVPPSPSSRWR